MVIFVKCKMCGLPMEALRIDKKFCPNCYRLRVNMRAASREGTENRKLAYQKYRNTDKYREYSRKRYHLMDENRRKARYYVRNAIRNGRLVRSDNCELCGSLDNGSYRSYIEAHHHKGYDREHWLDVIWLCTTCHKKEERNEDF